MTLLRDTETDDECTAIRLAPEIAVCKSREKSRKCPHADDLGYRDIVLCKSPSGRGASSTVKE